MSALHAQMHIHISNFPSVVYADADANAKKRQATAMTKNISIQCARQTDKMHSNAFRTKVHECAHSDSHIYRITRCIEF